MKLTPLSKALIFVVVVGAVSIGVHNKWDRISGTFSKATPKSEASPERIVPKEAPGKLILRLHGSNTIGAQLAPDLAMAFFKQQRATDAKVVVRGPDDVMVQAMLPGDATAQAIAIEAHGSSGAFTDLAAGRCDIGMSSRRVKPEEVTALSSLGDMTSAASENVLGLDGVAVIVHPSNRITSLTKDQLARIFSGEMSNWKDVQGPGGAIVVYRRTDSSGTTDTFKAIVMHGRTFGPSTQIEDSRQLSDRIANEPGAIGFVGLPYVQSAKAIAISESGAKALMPTRLTVATEDYALSRRLYLYTASNPTPTVRKFIDFALSKAGQDVVADAGFVSQNVASIKAVPAGGSSEYQRLAATAERLSLNFRFRSGSSQLDNKAIVDLDRVVSFITDLRYSGESVLLFGFADNRGGRETNMRLSKERAKAVADQFEQRGLTPAVATGFGADLPVASNDSDDGRERNRRVEIWVRKK